MKAGEIYGIDLSNRWMSAALASAFAIMRAAGVIARPADFVMNFQRSVLRGAPPVATGIDLPEEIERGGCRPEIVSVVVTCRGKDGDGYLEEALDSVLTQTHRETEVIVINSGPRGRAEEVARSFFGVRCINMPGQGFSGVRNTGLRHCTGQYVIFLDAEDRMLPHAIETGLMHLRSHPGAAFAAGTCVRIGPDGSALAGGTQSRPECPVARGYEACLRMNPIWSAGAVVFRREIFGRTGGWMTDPAIEGSEDYEVFLRIARAAPVYLYDQVVAEERVDPEQELRAAAGMLRSTLTLLRRQGKFIRGKPPLEQAYSEGVRYAKEHYGDLLVDQLCTRELPAMNFSAIVQGALLLMRYCPGRLSRVARRRLTPGSAEARAGSGR